MDVGLEVGAALRQARLDLVRMVGGGVSASAPGALPGELEVREVVGFLREAITEEFAARIAKAAFPKALWTWGDPYLERSGRRDHGGMALGPAVVYLAVVAHDSRAGEPWLAFGARVCDFGSASSGFSGFESRVAAFGIQPSRPTMALLKGGQSDLPYGHAALEFDLVAAAEDVEGRTREYRESFFSSIAPFLAWARGQVPLDMFAVNAGTMSHGFAEDVEYVVRGRPDSARGSYVVRFDVGAGDRVLDDIAALDPAAEFERENNPITLWVRTRLVADEIRRIPGVKGAFRSSS